MAVDEGVYPIAAARDVAACGITHNRAGKLLFRGPVLRLGRIRYRAGQHSTAC
jgi:hypothetical protein